MIDTVSKKVREVLNVGPDSINGFASSEAGRALYVAHGPRESDIWLAELRDPSPQC